MRRLNYFKLLRNIATTFNFIRIKESLDNLPYKPINWKIQKQKMNNQKSSVELILSNLVHFIIMILKQTNKNQRDKNHCPLLEVARTPTFYPENWSLKKK